MNHRNLPPLDLKYTYSADATVPQLFSEAAMSFPDETALRAEQGEVSYSRLLRHTQGIARELRAAGAGCGSLVGLAMPRSCGAVGAILGTMFAGAAYVPLDIEGSPEALLRQQIADSGIAHVLVDGGASCKSAAWERCATIHVPSPFDELPELPESVTCDISAEDPAYVMFTSGSTGRPKGVVIPHRAIVRLVSGQHYLNFSPNEIFLLHSPLSFDASTLELWGSLLHGACLAIAPARAVAATEYRELLEQNEVTTLWMTAAIFHLVADYAPDTFRALRQLIVGGDVIQPKTVSTIQQMHPRLSIVNGYGPTENCTFTTCYRIPSHIDVEESLPIGRPIQHTAVYVLDPELQPVAEGETGELVTGGSGVALGYLNMPRETAERFISDPFSPTPGSRMYRTGDRVRIDPSGVFHFLGRFDKEVKISGRRVDLTELERLVLRLDAVRACAAFAVESGSGGMELALAVEMPSPGVAADQIIRKQLATQLPAALLPTYILVGDQLPVNSNGKLDRTAIKRELENYFISARPAPASETRETTLATVLGLWQELLANKTVSADDNFFDAGGGSLLLIRLHALLNQEYPGRLCLLDLFQATTARKLSALIDARASGRISPLGEPPVHQPAMQ
jgi:amino acid adenylation domain-containing protein